jgi:hypothetical protein
VWWTGNKAPCKNRLCYAASQRTELVPEPDAGFSRINTDIASESTNHDRSKIPVGNCRDLSFCKKKISGHHNGKVKAWHAIPYKKIVSVISACSIYNVQRGLYFLACTKKAPVFFPALKQTKKAARPSLIFNNQNILI